MVLHQPQRRPHHRVGLRGPPPRLLVPRRSNHVRSTLTSSRSSRRSSTACWPGASRTTSTVSRPTSARRPRSARTTTISRQRPHQAGHLALRRRHRSAARSRRPRRCPSCGRPGPAPRERRPSGCGTPGPAGRRPGRAWRGRRRGYGGRCPPAPRGRRAASRTGSASSGGSHAAPQVTAVTESRRLVLGPHRPGGSCRHGAGTRRERGGRRGGREASMATLDDRACPGD